MSKNDYNYSHVKKHYQQYDVPNKEDAYLVGWHKNEIMFNLYYDLFADILVAKSSILDIGCGVGSLIEFLTQHKACDSFEYLGLDILPEMIEKAQAKYPDYRFETRDVLVEPLDDTFDWVIISGVVNLHFDGKEQFWRELLSYAFSICKKGVLMNFLPQFQYQDLAFINQLCCEHSVIEASRVYQFAKSLTPHLQQSSSSTTNGAAIRLFREASEMPPNFSVIPSELLMQEETCKNLFIQKRYQDILDTLKRIKKPTYLCSHYYSLAKLGLGCVDEGLSSYKTFLADSIDLSSYDMGSRQLGCGDNDYAYILVFLKDLFSLFEDIGKSLNLGMFEPFFILDEHQKFFMGWQAYLNGEYASCVPLCRQVLSRFPNLYQARYHLAKSYVTLNEPLSALYHFNVLLSSSSSFQSVLPDVLVLYLKLGQKELVHDLLEAQPPSKIRDECLASLATVT